MAVNKRLLTSASTSSAATVWRKGNVMWSAWGTWNGATAQLQLSPDAGTTWINFDNLALTADGGFSPLELPEDSLIRVAISGAGGSTSLNSTLTRCEGTY